MTSAWTETKQRARASREAALASTFLALPEDLQSWHGKGRRSHAGRPRKLVVGTVAAASAK